MKKALPRRSPKIQPDEPNRGRAEWPKLLSAVFPPLAISIVALAAYFPSLTGDFVFDSRFLVLQDTRVHSITTEHLRQIFVHSYWWPYGDSGLYRPVTTLSFLANYWLGGTAPLSYHVANTLLHVTNAFLFFIACLRLTSRKRRAIVAALLWTVIPLSSETVANIAGRADLIATFFVLAGFLSYLRFIETNKRIWLLLIASSGLLGLFAKESAIALLPIVACHYWLNRRLNRREAFHLSVAMAVPALLLMFVRWRVIGAVLSTTIPFVDNPIAHASWFAGRLTALRVLGSYVQLSAWPARLSPDYSYPEIALSVGSATDVAAWATIATAMAIAWLFRANRTALLGFAIAFFGILPASNLLFATGTIMGERLTYLPSAGLCLSLVAICSDTGFGRRNEVAVATIAAVVLLGWTIRTNLRTREWTSELSLWQSAVSSGIDSAKAHRALAEALYDSDPQHTNLNLVLDHARTAVSLLSELPPEKRSFHEFRQLAAYNIDTANRADRFEATNRFREALGAVQTAIQILSLQVDPNDLRASATKADLYRLKAVANAGLANHDQAQLDAQTAIDLYAFHPLAYVLAANAALALQNTDAAAEALAMGAMVLRTTDLSNELSKLYQHVDPTGCSLQDVGGVLLVNPRCPAVRSTLCKAGRRAAIVLDNAGRITDAEEVRNRLTNDFKCE